ncbi:alpha-D-ribose 1-methylphosphonate 5-triphosphate diphosphatase [Actinoplanes sp. CA-131856]
MLDLGRPATGGSSGWPLGRCPADYDLGHVRAVLPDGVLDDARIVVRDSVIADIGPHPTATRCDIDGRGALCLPGLVDVHSDVLARECQPRPGAAMPADLALAATAGRLAAAGITTAYHGVAFQEFSPVGLPIGSPAAADLYPHLRAADWRVLHRVDIRSEPGVRLLRDVLDTLGPGQMPLVSHEDHTPGQGQYADPAVMRRWLVQAEQVSSREAASHVSEWQRYRGGLLDVRDATLTWLGELAQTGRIRLMGHDPATAEDVDALAARGAVVAEFPTTRSAAQAARDAGLLVVAGAPNVVRGASHSGNVSATELVARGLVDALASDYQPPAMLAAALTLVGRGHLDLPAAIALLTSGPARVAGLTDRGRLERGLRADLILVDGNASWPTVSAVLAASP